MHILWNGRKRASGGIRTHEVLRPSDLKSDALNLARPLMRGPGGYRTHNLQLRRLVHYPIVLQGLGEKQAFLSLERFELSTSDFFSQLRSNCSFRNET